MRTSTHFAVHIQVLQEYLASRKLRFGSPEDLLPFVELLETQGTFHDEVSSLTRAIFYGEDMLLTRMELLDLLCLAVGGAKSRDAEGDVHRAVRQLLVFVNGILLNLQGGAYRDSEEAQDEVAPLAHGASVTAYTSKAVFPRTESSVSRVLWKENDVHYGETSQLQAFEEKPTAGQLVRTTPYLPQEVVSPSAEESVAQSSETSQFFVRVSMPGHAGGASFAGRAVARLREQKLISRPALIVGCTAMTVLALLVFVPRHAALRTVRPDPLSADHQRSRPAASEPGSPSSSQVAVSSTPSLVAGAAPAVSAQSLLALRPPRDQKVIDIPREAAMQHLVFSPPPEDPLLAKMTDVQGQVALEVIISPQGLVESTLVLQGQGLLRGAAEAAVRRWRFRPYLDAGTPTAVQTTVVVDFRR